VENGVVREISGNFDGANFIAMSRALVPFLLDCHFLSLSYTHLQEWIAYSHHSIEVYW